MKNNKEFAERGGKFIIPVPYPAIVTESSKLDLFGVEIKNIAPVHADERGVISDLLNEKVNHVGFITTEKDAIRASHYHNLSIQYSYILSGKFEVTLAPYNQPENIKKVIMNAGELITIPPKIIHRFKAIERAVMINMESISREGTGYEDDVIRVKIEED